jgi:DNA-binding GntR family transcriptional regulator
MAELLPCQAVGWLPVKGSTSGAAAYERLRTAIVALELGPGTEVSEAQLVDGFGFSKAAVRAALARLRAEGLVVAEPRRGHVIAPLTMRDVLEIYDLRLLLEPAATEAAAGRIDGDELARLQALAEPAVDFDEAESAERFLAANRTIHLAIAEAAGNRRTARILERLLDDSERARLVALRAGAGGRGVRAREELQLVLAALEKGDGGRAAQLMAEAIRSFRDELVESLQRAALDAPLSGLAPASA